MKLKSRWLKSSQETDGGSSSTSSGFEDSILTANTQSSAATGNFSAAIMESELINNNNVEEEEDEDEEEEEEEEEHEDVVNEKAGRTAADASDQQSSVQKQKQEEEEEDPLLHKYDFDIIEECVYFSKPNFKRESKMRCECIAEEEEEETCLDGCLNRLLLYECPSKCNAGKCRNQRIRRREIAPVEVFNAGPKGRGLRTLEPLLKHDFIMEYVGEIINDKELVRRSRRYAAEEKQRHIYTMCVGRDATIDATMKGNISRFMNHSCDPNAETQKWYVDGRVRIGFFTRRSVAAGEELTFDYRFERFGSTAQKCLCGAEKCTGIIGGERPSLDISTETETAEERKERKGKQRRKREMMRDEKTADELKELLDKGRLQSREDVIKLNRLMVRCDEFTIRTQMIQLLSCCDENMLRSFVHLSGCTIIAFSLMDSSDQDSISSVALSDARTLQLNSLKLCGRLPIPNKTLLTGSKLLQAVQKIAAVVPKDEDVILDTMSWLLTEVETSSSSQQIHQKKSSSRSKSSSSPSTLFLVKNGGLPVQHSSSQSYRANCPQFLAAQLLTKWANLKEHFKIPKKVVASTADQQTVKETFQSNKIQRRRPNNGSNNSENGYNRGLSLNISQRRGTDDIGSIGRVRRGGGWSSANNKTTKPSPVAVPHEIQRRRPNNGSNNSENGYNRGLSLNISQRRGTDDIGSIGRVRRGGGWSSANNKTTKPSPVAVPHDIELNKTKQDSPVGARKRRSRFDIGPEGQSMPKPEELARRREFENRVNQEQKDLMESEFDLACDTVLNHNSNNNEMDIVVDDSMEIDISSPEESNNHVMTPAQQSTEGIGVLPLPVPIPVPPPVSNPAMMVMDPQSGRYWWQEAVSKTLVYALTPEQLAMVYNGDWSRRPHFVYEPGTGYIHEVRQQPLTHPPPPNMVASSTAPLPNTASIPLPEPQPQQMVPQQLVPSIRDTTKTPEQLEIERLKKRVAFLERELKIACGGQLPANYYADEQKEEQDCQEHSSLVTSHQSYLAATSSSSSSSASQQNKKVPPAALRKDWREAYDPEGNPYYYHIQTMETRWSPPLSPNPGADDEDDPGLLSSKWQPIEGEGESPRKPCFPPHQSDNSVIISPTKSGDDDSNEGQQQSSPTNSVQFISETTALSMTNPSSIEAEDSTRQPTSSALSRLPSTVLPSTVNKKRVAFSSSASQRHPCDIPAAASSSNTNNNNATLLQQMNNNTDTIKSSSMILDSPVSFSVDDPREREDEESQAGQQPPVESPSKRRPLPDTTTTTTAAADTSSAELPSEVREQFKRKLAQSLKKWLTPYREGTTKTGRISNDDDFKYVCRKITHVIWGKELKKAKNNPEKLKVTDGVVAKAKVYTKAYMERQPAVYSRAK